jgi:hypothetical protein
MSVLVIWVSLEEKIIMTFFLFLLIQTVTCPAPRRHTAKKTDSARESRLLWDLIYVLLHKLSK